MIEQNSVVILERLIQLMGVSFIYIYAIARFIGSENKQNWFKKRTRSSFFTRRGFMGEYINFGRPICWQGYAVMIVMYGAILLAGYLYLFVYPIS